MTKFKIKSVKKNNSHPAIKIALRKYILKYFKYASVLDVYGGNGLMFKLVWENMTKEYESTNGDSILWLQKKSELNHDIFDIDPYASPYEAMCLIGEKATKNKIGIVCTDGLLRRAGMMRTKIPKILQDKCKWPERDLKLLAAIYHQYPSYLKFAIKSIMPGWRIKQLAVKYGRGTWRQATCYYATVLKR